MNNQVYIDPLLEGLLSDVDPTFRFEDFKQLIADCLDYSQNESRIYQRLARIYGLEIAKALCLWLQYAGGDVQNGTKFNNITDEQVFNILMDFDTHKTIKTLKSTLGGGSSGVAVKLKNGLVIKKLFSDFKHQQNADFYQYCLKQKPDNFLKVVKIGKDYIISREVKAASDKCKKYNEAVKTAQRKAREYYKSINQRPPNLYSSGAPFLEFIEDDEIKSWVEDISLHLSACNADFSDFKVANLGEDDKGNVLVIDV